MKMKNGILTVLLLGLCFAGCDKRSTQPAQTEQEQEQEQEKAWFYVNTFAFNRINQYYLWKSEIEDELNTWMVNEEPIGKVKSIRYKDDGWTMLTDDYASFYGNVSGHRKSYGFDYLLCRLGSDQVSILVTYTYADSPAQKAGLKRGDVISLLNGNSIPLKTYATVINQALHNSDRVTLGLQTGVSIQLESKEMYENPVLLSKVFDCAGKKVGYLVYTNFTLDSYKDLIDTCIHFKKDGISELILDLRYNNGGFNLAEQFFASMLVPEAEVQAKNVLSKEIYNDELTQLYKEEGIDTNTYLETEYRFKTTDGKKYEFSTAGANVGINKLYAIVSAGTASASEALLGNLFPYLDVTLVGERTYGKFCSGLVMQGPDFYTSASKQLKEMGIDVEEGLRYTDNWGIYVMCSRFADKNGETRCMPDGLAPDYAVADNPLDGFALGDPQETMLARTLALCGYPSATLRSLASATAKAAPVLLEYERPGFGVYLQDP